MNPWMQRIESAEEVQEVVALARDYLATLTPEELATLPDECRPGRIRDEGDIDFWNLRLAEGCRARGAERLPLLQGLASFFLRASIQISRLADAEVVTRH